jgi:hypothetical protein
MEMAAGRKLYYCPTDQTAPDQTAPDQTTPDQVAP